MLRGLVSILVLLTASGCSDSTSEEAASSTAPGDGTWLSRMPGTDAWLGLTIAGEDAAVFVCGGEQTLDTHTRWMKTRVNDTSLDFEKDGWQLGLEFDGSDLNGALVDPGGVGLDVVASRIDTAGAVGLYFSFDSGCADGTIIIDAVSPDDVESQGVWCDDSGNRSQVTPVKPVGLDGLELEVTAVAPEGEVQFVMQRAVPSLVP